MRFTILVTSFALLFLGACATFPADRIQPTLNMKWLSQDVRPNGAVKYDKPSVQTDLTLTHPNGVYVGLLDYAGANDADLSSNKGDEIDYTIGYRTAVGPMKLDAGFSYFDSFELWNGSRGNILRCYGDASVPITAGDHTLALYLRPEFRFPASGAQPEAGAWLIGGVRHRWEIAEFLNFRQGVSVNHDTGFAGLDSGFIGSYEAHVNIPLSKVVSFDAISLRVYTPLSPLDDNRQTETALGAGIIVRF